MKTKLALLSLIAFLLLLFPTTAWGTEKDITGEIFRPDPPTIEFIDGENNLVYGTGTPSYKIVLTLPDGTSFTCDADENGDWVIALPDDITLSEGDVLKAVQYHPDYPNNPSEECIGIVPALVVDEENTGGKIEEPSRTSDKDDVAKSGKILRTGDDAKLAVWFSTGGITAAIIVLCALTLRSRSRYRKSTK
jgi:hypothetical protein